MNYTFHCDETSPAHAWGRSPLRALLHPELQPVLRRRRNAEVVKLAVRNTGVTASEESHVAGSQQTTAVETQERRSLDRRDHRACDRFIRNFLDPVRLYTVGAPPTKVVVHESGDPVAIQRLRLTIFR